jgi:hypothetical protein
MKAEVTAEHAWLKQLVGAWRFEMLPGEGEAEPHDKIDGTETVRMLGDIWLRADGRGRMPDGTPTETQMLLGYDPAQRAFVGTWIGSMMNHLWVYRAGTLDPERRILTLEAPGPAFDGPPGATANYRDQIEIVSADERLLHGNVQGEDGQWKRFMTARYRRTA